MRALFALILAAVPALAVAAPSGKVGLGIGDKAGSVEGALLELIGAHAEAISITKAMPKGGKRAAWVKAAEKSQGLRAIVTAEVKGKRLKLGLWVGGKPVSASGADLKGSSLEGAGKNAVKNWLASQLAPGATRTAAAAPEEEEEEEEAPPVVAPPAAPIRGPGGRTSRAAPVVAPPPAPEAAPAPTEDEPPAAPVAEAAPEDDRAITSQPAASGDHGGGFLGGTLGVARGMPPFARVRGEFNSVGRGFNYSDPITANLRPYSVTFMPTPGVSLELYPLTLTGSPVLAGLAVTFGVRTSLGVTSARANSDVTFPTTYGGLDVGALYRIQLGDGFDSFALIPSVSWSSTSFELAAVGNVREEQLPNVSYPGLKLGLGFDAPLFSTVRLFGDGGFVLVGGVGEIISDTFFRVGSVSGAVARIGLGIGVIDHVALELGVTYQHFFYDFDPEVGDAFIAGGALDQFVVGNAAIRVDL